MGSVPRRFSYALEQLHEDHDPRLAAEVVAPLACWLHLRGARGVHTFRRTLPLGRARSDAAAVALEIEIDLAWDTRPLVLADPRLAADLRRSALGKTALLEERTPEVQAALDLVATTCIQNRATVETPSAPGTAVPPVPPAVLSKARSRRLATLGDADDRWEATALLRDAAEQTLTEVAPPGEAPEIDRSSALAEAWALYLYAKDPLRAVELRRHLPSSALLPSSRPVHGELVSTFSRAVREVFGAGSSVDRLHPDQIRVLAESYPGVPELWWALSRRSPSPGERDLARARAVRLSALFEDEAAAEQAFATLEPRLRTRLRIELAPERRGAHLSVAAASCTTTALATLIATFTEGAPGGPVELVVDGAPLPDPACPGAFTLEVTAEGLAPFALEDLDRELADVRPRATARAGLSLLALVREHHTRLTVSEVGCPGPPALVLDSARAKALSAPTEAAARTTLDSRDIPQADDLERVFLVAETVAVGGGAPADIPPRQNSYYRRAAKILGLLTETEEPTPAGRLLSRLTPEERLRTGSLWFESSTCGDAWIRWSGGATLLDVAPHTAADFLRVSAPGLSRDTADRRAQTLASWHRTLSPHHYRRGNSPR